MMEYDKLICISHRKKMKADMHVENQIWWAIGSRIFPALLIKMDHHASTWGPPKLSSSQLLHCIWVMFAGKFPFNLVPSVNVLFVIVVTTKPDTLCTFSVVFHLREQLQLSNWFKKLFCCADDASGPLQMIDPVIGRLPSFKLCHDHAGKELLLQRSARGLGFVTSKGRPLFG